MGEFVGFDVFLLLCETDDGEDSEGHRGDHQVYRDREEQELLPAEVVVGAAAAMLWCHVDFVDYIFRDL